VEIISGCLALFQIDKGTNIRASWSDTNSKLFLLLANENKLFTVLNEELIPLTIFHIDPLTSERIIAEDLFILGYYWDTSGNLYFTECEENRIHKLSPVAEEPNHYILSPFEEKFNSDKSLAENKFSCPWRLQLIHLINYMIKSL